MKDNNYNIEDLKKIHESVSPGLDTKLIFTCV